MYHSTMENRHRSSRWAEVGSILVFALGVFALVSLFTYTPTDPSLYTHAHGGTYNACGRIGAFLSAGLLMAFGMGAFVLPAALFFVSASLLKREGALRMIGTLGGMS